MNLIDENIVESLKDILGDDYRALIDDFYAISLAEIELIINDFHSLSAEQQKNKIHTLKGSSANIGAQYLSKLFMAIEIGLETDSEYDLRLSLGRTKEYLEKTVQTLRAKV